MNNYEKTNWHLGLKEYLLWEGKPHVEIVKKSLRGKYFNVANDPSPINIVYIFIIVWIVRMVYNDIYEALPWILLFLPLPLILDWQRDKNHKLTLYAISDDYIQFKIKYLFTTKIHKIPNDNIIRINELKYKDGKSTLIFECNHKVNFKTIEYKLGKNRNHPTFERIDDAEEILALINPRIKKNNLKPLVYNKEILDDNILTSTRILFIGLIAFMFVYLSDFYLLPSYTVKDRVNYVSKTLDNGTGYVYHTIHDNDFRMIESIAIWENPEVEITLSPLYKQIKGVKNATKDFNERLDSGLNGLSFYFFFLLLSIFLGSYYILSEEIMFKEKYYKVLIFNAIMIGVVLFMWRLS